jgi:hypothetical protein
MDVFHNLFSYGTETLSQLGCEELVEDLTFLLPLCRDTNAGTQKMMSRKTSEDFKKTALHLST